MKNIIIDCDPGADDAIAIILALKSKELNVLGITIASGNAPSKTCAKNALDILKFCDEENIPVYIGENKPLYRDIEFTDEYCGQNGICDYKFLSSSCSIQNISAIDFIYSCAKMYNQITIVSIAPMTNIAKTIIEYPDIKQYNIEIVTMAGYYKTSDVQKQRSEWNVFVDPEAFKIVCNSGFEIYALGLDISANLTNDMVYDIINNSNNKYTEFLKKCSEFYTNRRLTPLSLLVDALPIAYLIDNSIAEFIQGKVKIEIGKVIDDSIITFYKSKNSYNFHAAYEFDFDRYTKILKERVFY